MQANYKKPQNTGFNQKLVQSKCKNSPTLSCSSSGSNSTKEQTMHLEDMFALRDEKTDVHSFLFHSKSEKLLENPDLESDNLTKKDDSKTRLKAGIDQI